MSIEDYERPEFYLDGDGEGDGEEWEFSLASCVEPEDMDALWEQFDALPENTIHIFGNGGMPFGVIRAEGEVYTWPLVNESELRRRRKA